ncbi:hypothetical protein Tco_0341061 [Tanacetum coccineum]
MKIMINDESDISDYEEDDLNILEDESTSDNESEVGTSAFYLADVRINKWHWRIMNWVLHKEITVKDADINNNGFLRKHNTFGEVHGRDGNADNSSWVGYCIADTETAKSDLINFIYDDETLQRPTAKAFQAKPIACPKYETADMINSQVLAMFSSESYTYRSHDEAIPHGNDDGNGKGCEDVITMLRNGSAAENAALLMQGKGASEPKISSFY